jgi:hypothetical protein
MLPEASGWYLNTSPPETSFDEPSTVTKFVLTFALTFRQLPMLSTDRVGILWPCRLVRRRIDGS